MPYSIDKYSGSTVAVVEDSTINNTLDIKLIGKNYAGYGEAQNENFVWLLENFANNSAPPRPITGQLWYDTLNRRLRVFDGTTFKNSSGIEVSSEVPGVSPPQPATVVPSNDGEMWYNKDRKQLFVWSGDTDEYLLIGPQNATGFDTTEMRSAVLIDVNGAPHPVILSIINGNVDCVFSNDEFVLDTDPTAPPDRFITGFPRIKRGITLKYTTAEGTNTNDYVYWGTSSNALSLGGIPASDFARRSVPSRFSSVTRFNDPGLTIGSPKDVNDLTDPAENNLAIFIDRFSSNPVDPTAPFIEIPVIKNQFGPRIEMQTTVDSVVYSPLVLDGNSIVPKVSDTANIGSTEFKYNTVYANTFDGVATRASKLSVIAGTPGESDFVEGSIAATAHTAAVRNANGDIAAREFLGLASTASALRDGSNTYPASEYVRSTAPIFNRDSPVLFYGGFRMIKKIGNVDSTALTVSTDGVSTSFSTAVTSPINIAGTSFFPLQSNVSDIGLPDQRYKVVRANKFDGIATLGGRVHISDFSDPGIVNTVIPDSASISGEFPSAGQATVGNQVFFPATIGAVNNTIAVRDNEGNIRANLKGTAEVASMARCLTIGNDNNAKRFASVDATPNTVVVRDNAGVIQGDISGRALSTATAQSAQTADTALKANALLLNGDYRVAATASTAFTIVARDADRNINANLFVGTATAARYADLAEKYLPDAEYKPGTVVKVGGEAEITAAEAGDLAIGVISTNPAFMMNKDLDGGIYVALKGRVPVRVIGPVTKGARLVAAGNGVAKAAMTLEDKFNTFGVSLVTDYNVDERVIEAVIL